MVAPLGFREPRNQELVDRLRSAGLQFQYESTRPAGGSLQGMTFVITGTLPNLSREEVKSRAFPSQEHTYPISQEELAEFEKTVNEMHQT